MWVHMGKHAQLPNVVFGGIVLALLKIRKLHVKSHAITAFFQWEFLFNKIFF